MIKTYTSIDLALKIEQAKNLVKRLYKDEAGNPILLTNTQAELFAVISGKLHNRVHVMSHTRWGKSLTVALAALTRVSLYPEKWAIIADSRDKSKIIMDYVISHIFDNEITEKAFLPDSGESKADIRRYKNKNRLNFKVGVKKDLVTGKEIPLFGEIFVGTAKNALGFGASNVIEDEAALIEDVDHSLVMRMLGDNPHDNFLVKIGNPFRRNHFLKSYHDPDFLKIVVNCYRSLEEGRMTEQTIKENRDYIFFKILYECMFPSANEIDESGYSHLFKDRDINDAVERYATIIPVGEPMIGLDVARGGRNYNVWVKRFPNYAEVILKNLDDDLTSVGDRTINLAKEHGVSNRNIFVDDTGVGGGVTDYLKKINFPIVPVTLGASAVDEDEVYNVRSQIYAGKDGLYNWVKGGGALKPHADWMELTNIRYKKNARQVTQLESKDEMRKNGIPSPDVADALALTFAKTVETSYYRNAYETNNDPGGVEFFAS